MGPLLVAAALLLGGSGCGGTPAAEPDNGGTAEPTASATSSATPPPTGPVTATVITISIDGLNPSALSQLGPGRLPELHALMHAGASTLNARTEVEVTETLPNHTGMLTGRPVDGPEGHEVDFNQDPGSGTVSSRAGRRIDSVFDVVHRSGRTTAMYASKQKFALFQRSWGSAIDRSVIDEDTERLVERLTSDLVSRPADFSFVHLAAPDLAGHGSGFMGTAYLRAVELVDRLVGEIRRAGAAGPLRGQAHLIITSDHGGRGAGGHSTATDPDDCRIPFIVSGPDVEAGTDLYALNPDYRDPGAGRPSYAGAQPVRNGDVAALATRLLGLRSVPGSVFGTRDRLDLR